MRHINVANRHPSLSTSHTLSVSLSLSLSLSLSSVCLSVLQSVVACRLTVPTAHLPLPLLLLPSTLASWPPERSPVCSSIATTLHLLNHGLSSKAVNCALPNCLAPYRPADQLEGVRRNAACDRGGAPINVCNTRGNHRPSLMICCSKGLPPPPRQLMPVNHSASNFAGQALSSDVCD